jgi:hypothetical protein
MNEAQYVPGMHGCSDGGCIFAYKAPGTMVTNGGCRCQTELQRTEQGMKAVRTINWLRRNVDWEAIQAFYAAQKEAGGYCVMGDNCLCGGDVPAVREGCFEWKKF